MNKYTTTQGDTFDIVAFLLWGNEKLMHKLIEANPDHQDKVFFSAGVLLNVPEIKLPASNDPVPPWK